MVPLPLTPILLPEKERLSLRNPNGKEDIGPKERQVGGTRRSENPLHSKVL